VVGLLFIYLFGAIQLKVLLDLDSYGVAFAAGGIPYLFFEPLKIAAAVVVSKLAKQRGIVNF
jgi:biotin transporter BioY